MFILVVERNSIGSQTIEGGNFHISQNDALSDMEFGDSLFVEKLTPMGSDFDKHGEEAHTHSLV